MIVGQNKKTGTEVEKKIGIEKGIRKGIEAGLNIQNIIRVVVSINIKAKDRGNIQNFVN